MKKFLRAAVSLFLAAVLFAGSVPARLISAGAAGRLDISVAYDEKGFANVTITQTLPDSLVRYTIDGSEPKLSSLKYRGLIVIPEAVLLRVSEFTEDGTLIDSIRAEIKPVEPANSAPAGQKPEEQKPEEEKPAEKPAKKPSKAAAPEFIMVCSADKTVLTIASGTDGASIYYTTDGSAPSESSRLYTGTLTFSESVKIRAVAVCKGYTNSDVVSIVAGVATTGELPEEKPVSQPTQKENNKKNTEETDDAPAAQPETDNVKLEPDSAAAKNVSSKIKYSFTDMNTGGTYINLLYTKSGYTIYYTTDGSAPVKGKSKIYSKRVKFTDPGYFRAYEYNKKGEVVAKLCLNIEPRCAMPDMACTGFSLKTRTIKLTSSTPGADIYYTIDGSDPDSSRTVVKYSKPFIVGTVQEIRTIAVKPGYKNSRENIFQAAEAIYTQKDFKFSDPLYSELAVLLNSERKANKLKTLELNETLTRAANVRAEELSVLWSYVRPDGTSFATAIGQAGDVSVVNVRELILSAQKTTGDVMKTIKETKEMKELLLMNDYNAIGVGYFMNENGFGYWSILLALIK